MNSTVNIVNINNCISSMNEPKVKSVELVVFDVSDKFYEEF